MSLISQDLVFRTQENLNCTYVTMVVKTGVVGLGNWNRTGFRVQEGSEFKTNAKRGRYKSRPEHTND